MTRDSGLPAFDNGAPQEPHMERIRQAFLASIIFFASLFAGFYLKEIYFLNGFEEWTRDLRIAAMTPEERENRKIILINITEDTFDTIDNPYRTPLDRRFLANLIDKLDSLGVEAIGLDFLLDTPTEKDKDEELREAIAQANAIVVLAEGDPSVDTTPERHTIQKRFFGNRPSGYPFVITNEFEGTVRRFTPRMKVEGKTRYHFAAQIARQLGAEIPDKDRMRIRWHGIEHRDTYRPPFAEYKAHEIDKFPASWFSNKVVLIGSKLAEIDRHRTPFSAAIGVTYAEPLTARMSGVTIHAHILSQLLDGKPSGVISPYVELVFIGLAAICGIVLSQLKMHLVRTAIIAGIISIGYMIFAIYSYRFLGFFLPFLSPLIAFTIALVFSVFFKAEQYKEQRKFIRSAFSKYVPESVVANLENDPSKLKLYGTRQPITALFTDLEGFTALSETLPTETLRNLITQYLDGISARILAQHGTIDKYLGDGTMSFFGAPENSDSHAEQAIICAFEIHAFTESFRRVWAKRGIVVGRTRIGIHTGIATVGNFGGEGRFDYTAIGDTVNTAARLESANKTVHCTALVSENTRDEARTLTYRPAGKLLMPGKQQVIMTYEPLAASSPRRKALDAYLYAYGLMEDGSPDAIDAFAKVLEQDPDDHLAAFHFNRIKNAGVSPTVTLLTK